MGPATVVRTQPGSCMLLRAPLGSSFVLEEVRQNSFHRDRSGRWMFWGPALAAVSFWRGPSGQLQKGPVPVVGCFLGTAPL